MTKQEFIAKQKTFSRVQAWPPLVGLVTIILPLLGWARAEAFAKRHQELPWLSTISTVGTCLFAVLWFAVFVWWTSRFERQSGHRCPNCRKRLFGFMASVAIATGSCGYCGETVLDEWRSSDHAR